MAQALPMILTIASTAVGAMGAMAQARAQRKSAEFNAEVAKQNAQAARQQAAQEAGQIDRQNRLRLGRLRASRGAAGIGTAGSVVDLVGDVVAQGELERQDALYRGEMRARGYRIEEIQSNMQASDARRAGRFAVAGTLLGGAGQAWSVRPGAS